ncbi:Signal peptidase I V [Planctomycetes bacterium MalM25]|nr:Signal peptidase I V [Planctomycetes bacterium MalM25]
MLCQTLRTAVLLASLVLAVQTFVALGWLRPVEVAGDSMAPSHADGGRLLVRRWGLPRRWDVVVLRSPNDAQQLLVKRVIGLPGEEITLREGRVQIDGQPLGNPPEVAGVYYGAMGHPVWRLGTDEWFVVGDNQPVSIDSRNWEHAPGVPTRLIVGTVAR